MAAAADVDAVAHDQVLEDPENSSGWWNWGTSWFKWCPTSEAELQKAEKRILKYVKTKYETKYVQIDNTNKIWTIQCNHNNSSSLPFVFVHGFGGGIGLWVQNYDKLSTSRPLYAFDLLGFGRSSRPKFPSDAWEAEDHFVDSIEEWRKAMNLNRFILVGHSLGAFLAASYTIKYPERVRHLFLVDPWGFPEKPAESDVGTGRRIPVWARAVGTLLKPFNILAGLRAAGPLGPRLVQKIRPDFQSKFALFDDDTIYNYIYHCNAQTPSGEAAFKGMQIPWGWAKNPMIKRVMSISKDTPMTFIYGSRSYMDSSMGYSTKYLRKDSQVDVHILQGAGHHVYSEKPDEFNYLMLKLCKDME
ncbi:1-acylglycerol-3-phosphate O-acyltransferase ABHD5-like [Ptychodera flava]|uniref:1-acylglycerol-3-phosphate O-acyltransferase ABHD5-like n=1 Tax=Ptychodera flava TaxID=63121 RepID=UPI003969F7BD